MDHKSITQLCIDLPEFGLIGECRWLKAGEITVPTPASGPYRLHITCDSADLHRRRFLCAVINNHGQECGEFQIACADVMKTMRGLYLRLSGICAYHLQQAYDRQTGTPAPITHEAIPEAGSAADQIAPLLPDWVHTTTAGRRQLHRCLFDVLGAQMEHIQHRTLLEMMGIAPAAEAEQRGGDVHSAPADFGNWHPNWHANDHGAEEIARTESVDEADWPDMPQSPACFHGLISRALN